MPSRNRQRDHNRVDAGGPDCQRAREAAAEKHAAIRIAMPDIDKNHGQPRLMSVIGTVDPSIATM